MITVHSGISKFHYAFSDAEQQVGKLDMPTGLTVPRRSVPGPAPQNNQHHVTLTWGDAFYYLEYEHVREAKARTLRYYLMPGDPHLAMAEAVAWKPLRLQLGSDAYTLKRQSLFRFVFDLFEGDHCVGKLRETTGFSLARRHFAVDLPNSLSLPVQGFVFFLAINQFMR